MNWNSLELGDVLLKILNSKKDFIEHKKHPKKSEAIGKYLLTEIKL